MELWTLSMDTDRCVQSYDLFNVRAKVAWPGRRSSHQRPLEGLKVLMKSGIQTSAYLHTHAPRGCCQHAAKTTGFIYLCKISKLFSQASCIKGTSTTRNFSGEGDRRVKLGHTQRHNLPKGPSYQEAEWSLVGSAIKNDS